MDFRFSKTETLVSSAYEVAWRAQKNYEALRLARYPNADRRTIASYTGWGCAEMQKKIDEAKFLQALGRPLTDAEKQALRANSLNAHYTDLGIARVMWDRMRLITENAKSLRILDPSAGSGFFFSSMPDDMPKDLSLTEIDIDPFACMILRAIHPDTRIIEKPFQEAGIEDESQDLIITNVPFGNYGVYDPSLPEFITSSIHNYFIAKSINLLRDRGWLAVITSRFTLDSKDARVREWIADRARLAAAVRLPNTTFRQIAGTEVVTDILFFEKVDGGTINRKWVDTGIVKIDDKEARINQHYIDMGRYMIGVPDIQDGMYGPNEWTLKGTTRLSEIYGNVNWELDKQLDGSVMREPERKPVVKVTKSVWDVADPDGRVKTLKEMHEALKDLLQAYSDSPQFVGRRQKTLRDIYDNFVAKYGRIADKKTEKIMAGNYYYASLKALEVDGKPAQIFTTNTINKTPVIPDNPTPEEALAISLQERGEVSLQRIAQLLKTDEEEATILLNGLVYQTPDGGYEIASKYLSGNIREKLKEAVKQGRPENIKALEAVMPKPLTKEEIFVQLCSPWLPTDVITEFMGFLLKTKNPGSVSYDKKINLWDVRRGWGFSYSLITHTWGTSRVDFYDILENILNQKSVQVYDRVDDKSVLNKQETIAAQMKVEEINVAFEKWVWQDDKRAERLCAVYNTEVNIWVAQKIDHSFLTFPGMSSKHKIREYQKNAVAFSLFNSNALLWHPVGYGKTLTAIMSAAEQIRIGISQKVVITCPINTVGQWVKEISDAYPGMEVLWGEAGSFSPENRAEFLTRIAVMQRGIVIIPHSSFKLIPIDQNFIEDILRKEIDDLRWHLQGKDTPWNAKKVALKFIENRTNKLKALALSKKDNADIIQWGQLGIDLLIVDEAHEFKNLERMSRITNVVGLSSASSEKAYDLLMKVRYMQGKGKRTLFLSATPLCNSIAELHTWQKYQGNDMLEEVGLEIFDKWVGTFGKKESVIDIKPDGSGFRVVTKFTGFMNLPELTAMMGQFCHAVSKDAIVSGIPKLETGAPIMVSAPASWWLKEFTANLAGRAERIHAGNPVPENDNMLVVVGDGRKAALDPRLINPGNEPDNNGKVTLLSQVVVEIYKTTQAAKSTQLIFCDLGTPKYRVGDEREGEEEVFTDVYSAIKANLVRAGVKEEEIAYAHDANTIAQKKKLIDRINEGEIRVCISSTQKMGLGTNAQKRMIAVHNLDCPWRPDQLEQRIGRVQRPGNTNERVFVFNYITTESLDGFVWQYILAKSAFIDQYTKHGITGRSAEDIGEMVLTAQQMKAIGSGNPLLMEEARLANQAMKLEQARISHEKSVARLRAVIETAPFNIQRTEKSMRAHIALSEYWEIVKNNPFFVVLGGKEYTEHGKAGDALNELVHSHMLGCSLSNNTQTKEIGEYKGFVIKVKAFASATIPPECWVEKDDTKHRFDILKTGVGTMNSVNSVLKGFGSVAAREKEIIEKEQAELESATKEAGKPWEYEKTYLEIRQRLVRIRLDMERWEEMTLEEKRAATPKDERARPFQEVFSEVKEILSQRFPRLPPSIEPARIEPSPQFATNPKYANQFVLF